MSLFDRFFNTINSFFPSNLSDREVVLLSQLDTHRIYVENVRSILGVSHKEALALLETAVRQGVFHKGVEVLCPDDTGAAWAETEEKLPPTVPCWSEDQDGHPYESKLSTRSLRKVVFYSLEGNDGQSLLNPGAS